MTHPPPASNDARFLARVLGITTTFAAVLRNRGYGDDDPTRRFLEPRLAHLSPPHDMAGRAVAIDRIAFAIRNNERISLFGDYDCDGITSVAILTEVLRTLGGDITPMLANRFAGGYGVTDMAADAIIEFAPALLITCDCGSSDHERLHRIAASGVEIIVIDHHLVPAEPLPAVAFLNPHRPDCPFPFKHLSSCGLAMSLAAGVRTAMGSSLDIRKWLDLVAIGTVADVVPLEGDNRSLVRAGMRILEQGLRPGIRHLAEHARIPLHSGVTSDTIAFDIAPRINAPGRLGSPQSALALLMAQDPIEARDLAIKVEALRTERRLIQDRILREAYDEIEEKGFASDPAIVLGRQGWHPGIVGIVASQITEKFRKPSVVIAFDDKGGRGSARGPSGTPIYDLLTASREAPIKFGGHQAAAGLEIHESALNRFRDLFNNAVTAHHERVAALGVRATVDPYAAEVCLDGSDEPIDVVRDLGLLEPCGLANPLPRMALLDAKVVRAGLVRGGHLQVRLLLEGHSTIYGFGYGLGAKAKDLPADCRVDVVGWLRKDTYRGGSSVGLRVDTIDPVKI